MKLKVLTISLYTLLALGCKDTNHLFRLVDASQSGIDFNNKITINDSINILDNEFTYNGAGVAVGDLNGDGLQDIYFAGNQVPNRLYLNKGELRFEDVTEKAQAQKTKGQWSSGVTLVDINGDQRQDIYVCNTMSSDSSLLRDLLFINQGNNSDGIPQFKEMGIEYGINDNTQNSISTFFDYDLDGDLDLFIAVNFIDMQYPNQFITRIPDGKSPTRDLLYRNDYDSILGHGVYKDVSMDAGIIWGGYSHSALIHDFNEDGYPDIYVANDYLSNDLIYINNKNGTFTNRVADIFKHQSYSSMGSDIADVNGDGHADMFTVEMLPIDNKRKKVNMNANNYNHYLFTEQYKYEYQFVRNTFQVYQGKNPDTQLPLFSDIAFLAGVEATDWSWSPLLADFDNDGHRDLLITNGFPKDIIDHDFGAFRKSISSSLVTRGQLLDMIPEVKIPNFIFKNNGDLTFTDVSKQWGINLPSFTNGTAYADLDNDGDLDIITNNIDDPAFLLENKLYDSKKAKEKTAHFLRINLKGAPRNPNGYGTQVTIWSKGIKQVSESQCVRGYLSKSEYEIHFGLGNNTEVDSLQVQWPDGKLQKLGKQKGDQIIQLNYAEAKLINSSSSSSSLSLLNAKKSSEFGIKYTHLENDFIDFNLQKTLPHKFSQYGPAIAVGDVNGDGLDDMILGSSSRFNGPDLFIQQSNGKFISKNLSLKTSDLIKEEDMGLLLFDADRDGDNDLYIVRGSYQHEPGSNLYQDVLFENDGKGNFKLVQNALPVITSSGQNVKASDIDGDGDLDLFVGGRVEPKYYPKAGLSLLLRNDSESGKIKFTDITKSWSPELSHVGMVSDALWTDVDQDGRQDLLLACEWCPLILFKNTGSGLVKMDLGADINSKLGWWNSIAAGDIDLDGDIDYTIGNFGMNQYFKCSSNEPLRIYSKDFDQNGSYDAFISCYFPDSSGTRREYFFHSKDDMQKQLILIRKKFENYADFGRATVSDVFTKEEMKDVQVLEANYMKSAWLENLGGGKFSLHELPLEAQFAPLYGMKIMDVDGNMYPDLILTGNDFGMETGQGRADAFNGLILLNQGDKKFKSIGFEESGFFVPGDARALSTLKIQNKQYLVTTENRGVLRFFGLDQSTDLGIVAAPEETHAVLYYPNGLKQRIELSWGSSFLSQDSRYTRASIKPQKIEVYSGIKRTRIIQ